MAPRWPKQNNRLLRQILSRKDGPSLLAHMDRFSPCGTEIWTEFCCGRCFSICTNLRHVSISVHQFGPQFGPWILFFNFGPSIRAHHLQTKNEIRKSHFSGRPTNQAPSLGKCPTCHGPKATRGAPSWAILVHMGALVSDSLTHHVFLFLSAFLTTHTRLPVAIFARGELARFVTRFHTP